MTRQQKYQKYIFTAFMIVYSVLLLYALARFSIASHWGNSWHGATLVGMVGGTAAKPYVYRVLVPGIIAFFLQITPGFLQQWIGEALLVLRDNPLIDAVFMQNANPRLEFTDMDQFRTLCYMRMIAGSVMCLSLTGYVIALYRLSEVLFPNQPGMALFTPVIGLIAVPALDGIYIYDFPALCLAACGYYALSVQKWRWYMVWFTLACLNKETSIFMCIFYVAWFHRRLPAQLFKNLLTLQLAIYVSIKVIITCCFMDNPGVFIMTHWEPLQEFTILQGYNYRMLITYCAGIFLLTYDWQQKPLFARYGLLNFLLMCIAFLLFGHPGEFRVFYDVLPLLVVLLTHTLIKITGISKSIDAFWTFPNTNL